MLPTAGPRFWMPVPCHQRAQSQVEAAVGLPVNVFRRVPGDLISVFLSVYPDFLLSDGCRVKVFIFLQSGMSVYGKIAHFILLTKL